MPPRRPSAHPLAAEMLGYSYSVTHRHAEAAQALETATAVGSILRTARSRRSQTSASSALELVGHTLLLLHNDEVKQFDAPADPARRRILEVLTSGDATACALSEVASTEFGISQPATSRHLRVLRESGLVLCEPTARNGCTPSTPLECRISTSGSSNSAPCGPPHYRL